MLMYFVAPHAGAWIEIQEAKAAFEEGLVAPHAGAWIEIAAASSAEVAARGRAPRGRVD